MEDCHSVKLSRLLALTVLVLNGSLFRNLTLVSYHIYCLRARDLHVCGWCVCVDVCVSKNRLPLGEPGIALTARPRNLYSSKDA